MTTYTRRVFGTSVLAVAVAARASAAPVPKVAGEGAEEPDPVVEMDGKPKQNPKGRAGGTITVTGVVRPPTGYKVEEVVVQRQSTGATNKNVYITAKANVDITKVPITWKVELTGAGVGEHWVDVRAELVAPDGQRYTYESLDRRRARVPAADK